jgi:hypothetical protein
MTPRKAITKANDTVLISQLLCYKVDEYKDGERFQWYSRRRVLATILPQVVWPNEAVEKPLFSFLVHPSSKFFRWGERGDEAGLKRVH